MPPQSEPFLPEPVPPPAEPLGLQLLISIAPEWSSTQGRLCAYTRSGTKAPWKLNFSGASVLGRNGLGWGLGIHGWVLNDAPVKQEGDQRSPAGLFGLPFVFGYASVAEAKIATFPYLPLTKESFGVDDPLSADYNRVVTHGKPSPPPWRSAETMLREDGTYRRGVFIAHNDPGLAFKTGTASQRQPIPLPGQEALGSCIFLHVWQGPTEPTSGCTALCPQDMERIALWLDAKKYPLLLQLPTGEYNRLRTPWNLPD